MTKEKPDERTPLDIIDDVTFRMALRAEDANERVRLLRTLPDDYHPELADLIGIYEKRLEASPTFVAIERARVLGPGNPRIEGCVFVLQADGSLKPADGQDLVRLDAAHPNFVKRWRIQETG